MMLFAPLPGSRLLGIGMCTLALDRHLRVGALEQREGVQVADVDVDDLAAVVLRLGVVVGPLCPRRGQDGQVDSPRRRIERGDGGHEVVGAEHESATNDVIVLVPDACIIGELEKQRTVIV